MCNQITYLLLWLTLPHWVAHLASVVEQSEPGVKCCKNNKISRLIQSESLQFKYNNNNMLNFYRPSLSSIQAVTYILFEKQTKIGLLCPVFPYKTIVMSDYVISRCTRPKTVLVIV